MYTTDNPFPLTLVPGYGLDAVAVVERLNPDAFTVVATVSRYLPSRYGRIPVLTAVSYHTLKSALTATAKLDSLSYSIYQKDSQGAMRQIDSLTLNTMRKLNISAWARVAKLTNTKPRTRYAHA